MMPDRRQEIGDNLHSVRDRVAAACVQAGRDPTEVTLVAVTKTYPADDVLQLVALGVTDVGENRDQEAAPKARQVGERLPAGAAPRWHVIGQLQRNKCRSVAGYATVVQSVDSVPLARALSSAALAAERRIEVFVQVSIDGDPHRGGAVGDELARVVEAVAGGAGLELRGLMAVAPLGWEPERAFAELAGIAAATRARYPQARLLSAGMSGDFEQAIRHGATHIRVGSALLGTRPRLV